MFKFIFKVGLAGTTVYYLAEQGVWKRSTETTKLYGKISDAVSPYLEEAKAQLPMQIPELPNSGRVSYLMKQYWNEGVTATFLYIGDLPHHVSGWTTKGIEAARNNEELKKFFDSFSTQSVPAVVDVDKKK